MSKENIYNCISCETGKSGFKFCSGICDLPEKEAVIKLKNKEIQFLNDNHDVELFCKLSNTRNYFNHYYTGENEFSETPFDIPIIRISKIKKNKPNCVHFEYEIGIEDNDEVCNLGLNIDNCNTCINYKN